jgi:circadian clock protein KaiC
MLPDRVPTGISDLDRMLEGGIPRSRIIVAVGGLGTGKTLLGMQFIINGIEDYDESGIFVSLVQSKIHATKLIRMYHRYM